MASVNLAATEIGGAPQKTAALFEETSAASYSLSGSVKALATLAHHFRTSEPSAQGSSPQSVSARPTKPVQKPVVQMGVSAQVDEETMLDDGWDEF